MHNGETTRFKNKVRLAIFKDLREGMIIGNYNIAVSIPSIFDSSVILGLATAQLSDVQNRIMQ